jgi:hypothetical protein
LITIGLAVTQGIAATPSGQADIYRDFRSMNRQILQRPPIVPLSMAGAHMTRGADTGFGSGGRYLPDAGNLLNLVDLDAYGPESS